MIQYSLHAQVLELRALHNDGREVHIPVAINNSNLGDNPGNAIGVLERRIDRAHALAVAMLAVVLAPPPDLMAAQLAAQGERRKADIEEVKRVVTASEEKGATHGNT